MPDPLALGVRFVELGEIQQERTQADTQARTAAQALLTDPQRAKLQSLLDTAALAANAYTAEVCHLLKAPAGTTDYGNYGAQCPSSF